MRGEGREGKVKGGEGGGEGKVRGGGEGEGRRGREGRR